LRVISAKQNEADMSIKIRIKMLVLLVETIDAP
jgi:hypothetical protein